MKKIIVAGASGFIGKYLVDALLRLKDVHVIALSRRKKKSEWTPNINEGAYLEWRECDLFSVKSLERVMQGVDAAFYLVHSMQPSARLDQATFIDYDLILADNFGRAAQANEVNRVIYLSGIIPHAGNLSKHLSSRLEVEQVLKEYFSTYTILRAGLILGRDGSSFNILYNLVKRLPILICPRWGENETSPVYYKYVIDSLVYSYKSQDCDNRIFDLCSKDNVSYFELLKLTALSLGLKRIFVRFPYNINSISRLWVSLFSGASSRLVYPLLDSLSHSMTPRPEQLFPFIPQLEVKTAIDEVVQSLKHYRYKFTKQGVKRKTVRSVQRFLLPPKMSAYEVAMEYMAWLPRFLSPVVKVDIRDNEWVYFSMFHSKLKLLILRFSAERSDNSRVLFYIKGGLLASSRKGKQSNQSAPNTKAEGRLEFRSVLNKRYALAAIHEFRPSLPWYIYRYTQAIIHLLVMRAFGKHLQQIIKENKSWLQKS